ncbi:MAG: GNAT family N-acetyltransferase [Clostridia bacterium]|nr:GNAT family N-acetyltransferase [Clostridia bacterium]
MNKQTIWQTALRQSATDLGCTPEDLTGGKRTVVLSRADDGARRYLSLPFFCNLVSYGDGIVASVAPEFEEAARRYINTYPAEHCFETPNMNVLAELLRPHGHGVCFMAEYFLPDPDRLQALPCPYPTRLLTPDDFASLYLPEWSNALCEKRKHLDMLGVGAYDGDRLIALAGASADCDTMWQIGIDVLPAYRRQGIASALTSRLAVEILARGKVPFYCAAWSNIPSVRNAIHSGFLPAWTELTAKPLAMIDEMNAAT